MEVTRGSELLKLRTLRSPIDGVVMERTLGPGEYVGSDQTHLLTIAQIDPLYVEVYVPVSQFGKIRLGMQGEVRRTLYRSCHGCRPSVRRGERDRRGSPRTAESGY